MFKYRIEITQEAHGISSGINTIRKSGLWEKTRKD